MELFDEKKKYHFDRVFGLPDNWEWCYSARDFQKQLNQLTKGLVLEKLYVYLDSYLDRSGDNPKCLNLSFVGGYSLLIFNKLAIAFVLHVEGMVEYSIFSPNQIRIEEKYDYMPDRYDPSYADLIELKDYFEEEYSEKRVIKAEVKHTDMWGFRLEGFDVECAKKAADANDLPERIVFHLSNNVHLKLICDDLEYCYIIVEKVNPLNHK
jgi:hypothetical protein